jgi:hypothetical protein
MKRALFMVSISACGQVEAQSDAPCVTQLLVNPAFDEARPGTGWAESISPIIDDDKDAHSPPNTAWLGGDVGVADFLYQQITIPANTTLLQLSGYWDVYLEETSSSLATRRWSG